MDEDDVEPPAGEPQETPLDEKLFADLHRGSIVGGRVAELRPDWRSLGAGLESLVELYECAIRRGLVQGQIAEVEAHIDDLEADRAEPEDLEERYAWKPWLPNPGSQAAHDFEDLLRAGFDQDFLQCSGRDDFGRVLYLVRRLIESPLDHLRSIDILFQAGRMTRSPIALARIALEASARAWHILEPQIGAQERLFRCLNAELDALDEEKKAARREGDENELREAGGQMKAILQAAQRQGGAKDPGHGSRIEPYIHPAAMIDDLLMREHHSTYHELSKIVHSQEDEGFRIAMGLAGGEGNAYQPVYVAMHVLAPILALTEAAKRLFGYAGWPSGELEEPTAAILQLWACGAGLADAHYRAFAEAQLIEEGVLVPPDEADRPD